MTIETSEMVDVLMIESPEIESFITNSIYRDPDDEILELLLGEE